MTILNKFTVVLAVDAEHFAELLAVWPTWTRFHPEIRSVRILIYCDTTLTPMSNWSGMIRSRLGPNFWPIPWERNSALADVSQREFMLSAFVLDAPRIVPTDYWLKIDTDTIATASGPLVRDEWLEGNPALFAQKWGYTKPPEYLDRLDRWAESCELPIRNQPFRRKIVGNKANHRRVISYFMGVETAWSIKVAKACGRRMPVPSQDTLYHFAAARCGDFYRTIDVKAAGWRHVGSRSLERLRNAADEATRNA